MPDHINYKQTLELVSIEPKGNFDLDVICKRNPNSDQGTNQLRMGKVVLFRLDYNVIVPHKTPDSEYVYGSHLDRFVEGFNDQWAKKAPTTVFSEFKDQRRTLREFLKYCNVVDIPIII